MAGDVGISDRMTVVRAARLLDGRGGPPLEPAVVVIRGKEIAAVGDPQKVEVAPRSLSTGYLASQDPIEFLDKAGTPMLKSSLFRRHDESCCD